MLTTVHYSRCIALGLTRTSRSRRRSEKPSVVHAANTEYGRVFPDELALRCCRATAPMFLPISFMPSDTDKPVGCGWLGSCAGVSALRSFIRSLAASSRVHYSGSFQNIFRLPRPGPIRLCIRQPCKPSTSSPSADQRPFPPFGILVPRVSRRGFCNVAEHGHSNPSSSNSSIGTPWDAASISIVRCSASERARQPQSFSNPRPVRTWCLHIGCEVCRQFFPVKAVRHVPYACGHAFSSYQDNRSR